MDLVEIAFHIAEQNLVAADRWLETIDEKCQRLARMPELAATGADFVSIGALTHSAPAADLSFEIELGSGVI